MLYSKWLPDRGGYAYYETSERLGLSDDLPAPKLSNTSAIGVASTDIGRQIPFGAKLIGSGPLAQGCVAPLDRSGLSGISEGSTNTLLLLLLGGASFVAGLVMVRSRKQR